MANYKGREATSRGGLVGALEEYARTGVPVGEKHKSDHIKKAEDILNILKKEEKKIKNSTLSQADREALLLRIDNLRNSIMPAYQKAKQRKKSTGSE